MAKKSGSSHTKTLRLRIRDKHAQDLRALSQEVNFVWNYINDLSQRHIRREGKFLSAYDIHPFTVGAGAEGLRLHSQTLQRIAAEYVKSRKQARRAKLRWRVSRGARRSLGWIPFAASALRYRAGQIHFFGLDRPLGLWDSYGLANFSLGAGSISEDARGRWYLNVCVEVPEIAGPSLPKLEAIGIDLGLKEFAAFSDGRKVEAEQFYRASEQALGRAQRANKPARARAIHAKIRNRRLDHAHKLSRELVNRYRNIAVGNVNAAALSKVQGKSVLDAGWSQFRNLLMTKSDHAAVRFLEVNEAFTTQECYMCGSRSGPKGRNELEVRSWTCQACGADHDRDTNAAQNILARAMAHWNEEVSTQPAHDSNTPSCVNKDSGVLPLSPLGHERPAVGIPFL